MRRVVTTISATCLSLLLVVAPVLAAEEGDPPQVGSMNGILLGLILGVVVGIALFFEINAGDHDSEAFPREH